MAHVVLFHHVLGLTDGVRAFAEQLAVGGHTIHTPDLYEGDIGDSIEGGFSIRERIGNDVIAERAEGALAGLTSELVYAGMSMGVVAAQRFTQTRPGARGALLYEACVPITGDWAFGPWPDDVPVQVHGMDDDQFFAHEGDLDAARELVAAIGPELGEVFTYPGNAHLFLDSSLPSYDSAATDLVVERSAEFLDRR
ncbi:MAG: dienelactone hydrolase family protein [Acidimicrobiia bacterium]|nr:dienelactone hydrolase family protein [Acidimicrobiia bacterium]